jgi:hypothetical protein
MERSEISPSPHAYGIRAHYALTLQLQLQLQLQSRVMRAHQTTTTHRGGSAFGCATLVSQQQTACVEMHRDSESISDVFNVSCIIMLCAHCYTLRSGHCYNDLFA